MKDVGVSHFATNQTSGKGWPAIGSQCLPKVSRCRVYQAWVGQCTPSTKHHSILQLGTKHIVVHQLFINLGPEIYILQERPPS
jgi:hypothetical protein